jgi:hypothetical protein
MHLSTEKTVILTLHVLSYLKKNIVVHDFVHVLLISHTHAHVVTFVCLRIF